MLTNEEIKTNNATIVTDQPVEANTIDKIFSSNKLIYILLIISSLFFLFSFFTPFLFTHFSIINFTGTGQIGDTISGTMMPFISIVGSFLTFLAFIVQFNANQIQIKAMHKQENENTRQEQNSQIVTCEGNFIEFYKIFLNNISRLSISISTAQTLNGMAVFDQIYNDYKNTYYSCSLLKDTFNKSQISIMAYLFLYYGERLASIENDILGKKSSDYKQMNMKLEKIKLESERPLNLIDIFYMENGYETILSYYFSQLEFLFDYIDTQTIFDPTKKEFLIKTITSNMSYSEKILLFYHAMSPKGNVWISKNYFLNYKILQNLDIDKFIAYSPCSWLQETYFIDDTNICNYFSESIIKHNFN